MKRRTTDVGHRVADIVDKLANEIWRHEVYTLGHADWFQIWIDCYNEVLLEFYSGVVE